LIPLKTAFLLYTIACPAIPDGSAVRNVSCEATPTRIFASFEACFQAKEEAKRAPAMDVFAVCVQRGGASGETDPEWD
jgi:hypothetical protein